MNCISNQMIGSSNNFLYSINSAAMNFVDRIEEIVLEAKGVGVVGG